MLLRSYTIGDEVYVGIAANIGIKAVALAYILPLMLVLFVFFISNFCGVSEQKSGIFSIIFLIPYYLWLFLTQRSKKKFHFTISKK